MKGGNVESVTSWIFEQGSIVVSYAIGVGSTYIFMNKVNQERITMMEKNIAYLKDELKELREELTQSDVRCEARVKASAERYHQEIKSLKDIFLNTIKSIQAEKK